MTPKVDRQQRGADVGDPASLIIDYTNDNGIDLICLPTHGYGTFRRALLGSVTAKVLHDAGIPVWTSAHSAGTIGNRAHLPSNRRRIPEATTSILDISTRATLDAALAVAKESGATLDIVTAVPEGVIGPAVVDADLETSTKRHLVKVHGEGR